MYLPMYVYLLPRPIYTIIGQDNSLYNYYKSAFQSNFDIFQKLHISGSVTLVKVFYVISYLHDSRNFSLKSCRNTERIKNPTVSTNHCEIFKFKFVA